MASNSAPLISISKIVFGGGTSVTLEPGDVVLLVGPNNVGKSQALRDFVDVIAGTEGLVVKGVELARTPQPPEWEAWLEANCSKKTNASSVEYVRAGREFSSMFIRHGARYEHKFLPPALAKFLCVVLTAQQRMNSCEPTDNFDATRGPPQQPMQFLLRDGNLEDRISKECKALFGKEVILDRLAGSRLRLYWGKRPTLGVGEDRLSPGYSDQLVNQPTLSSQGDGVKSFVGTLLSVMVDPDFLILLDEPEAFLHPPQARQLGRLLARLKNPESQTIVATHSLDLLKGMVSDRSQRMHLIRLSRIDDVTKGTVLDATRLGEYLKDTAVRNSDILNSVFHELVVLCEGDADCLFFQALTEAIGSKTDTQFISAGGKSGFKKFLPVVRALGVPVRVVSDFDILNTMATVKQTVSLLGGEWTPELEANWRTVNTAVTGLGTRHPTGDEVRAKIKAALQGVGGTQPLDEHHATKVADAVKFESGWQQVKKIGKFGVPSGMAQRALESLLLNLKQLGLHVVPVGELEGFDRDHNLHGSAWVAAVFENHPDFGTSPKLKDAREFVTELTATGASRADPTPQPVVIHEAPTILVSKSGPVSATLQPPTPTTYSTNDGSTRSVSVLDSHPPSRNSDTPTQGTSLNRDKAQILTTGIWWPWALVVPVVFGGAVGALLKSCL